MTDGVDADIRELAALGHEHVAGLNFVRGQGELVFRRHFRSGLRSHVMEVLAAADVALERHGRLQDGVLRFPRAQPRAMLRLFRARFATAAQAVEEIRRLRQVERCLGRDQVALSNEFLVSYRHAGATAILLCGLQQYVAGEPLDPWLESLAQALDSAARAGLTRFVAGVKRLIVEAGLIPDLAGAGNMLITARGEIKLVDINNIAPVRFQAQIPLDDRGYPVCDKSMEALFRLECCGRPAPELEAEPLYRFFLAPPRRAAVAEIHRRFHQELS